MLETKTGKVAEEMKVLCEIVVVDDNGMDAKDSMARLDGKTTRTEWPM